MRNLRITELLKKLSIVLAVFTAAFVTPGLGAQVYAPTSTHCTTGSAAPINPTGPQYPGQFAELTSMAPNNYQETCTWSQFAAVNTVSTRDLTLSFTVAINVEGSNPIARVSAGYAGGGQVLANLNTNGIVSMTIPAGTDLSTVSVTAIAKAANTSNCLGTPTPTQCFNAESTIDVYYISLS
jgi:hypothetical protein